MVDYAAALLVRNDRVLMGYRSPSKAAYPSTWDSIGGRVEAGETIADALIRELQEEIGVTPTRWSLLETRGGIETHEGIAHIYIHCVSAWGGGEPAMLGDEHTEIRWFSLDELSAIPNLASTEYIQLAARALAAI